MNVLIVVSHPRQDSLTFRAVDRFAQGLKDAGHQYEIVDLHRIGFDPILQGMDEPNMEMPHQKFSPQIETEMERLKRHDAVAFVFPLWWWHLPAMLKGYIDRVMNNGFAYGADQLHLQKVLWLTLTGVSKAQMDKRNYRTAIENLLNVGIADYCGVSDSHVEFLYETSGMEPEHYERLLEQAYRAGLNYAGEHVAKQ
ncbi:NAD(P)H oxidoreductase [Paenibacillus hunanensis]|uniref:NADPH-quinone reductase n=1 Tax=Paenibacillus hunanensis TaxID=539262 RepID=A0ABU1J3N2_9BACL|nr:NAD(P)H oxidoreductase [Paenibacillus hunanensis]MCL9662485.1 NAD(P)H oxidoreductase [Paenibacillus hunanensis]MDR6245806.1 putative NADPH-quinone reductase [Paenibacillus hunanensis]GGJ16642.1 NAD(P)H-dependent oxidoreductase [Paenibacillus hunanensis]